MNFDTDGDYLSDKTEYEGWTITLENGAVKYVAPSLFESDTDKDTLSDYQEYLAGTNPQDPDTDGDLLRDDEDPFPLAMDGDNDGLTDYEELCCYGTNVNLTDTDLDGLSDGYEIKTGFYRSDPLCADTDHDLIKDSAEYYRLDFAKKWTKDEAYIGKKRAPGIVHGKNTEEMLVEFIPNWISIEVGEEVYTSGLDNLFFIGLKVGKVLEVTQSQGFQNAKIKPYFDVTKPEYFQVIMNRY